MKVNYLVLMLFVAVGLNAYDLSSNERIALAYIFGAQTMRDVQKDIDIVDSTTDYRVGEYDRKSGKIRVSSAGMGEFQKNLIVVHEATHWYQDHILHQKSGWGFQYGADAYTFNMEEILTRQSVEREAEVTRQLAVWFINGMKLGNVYMVAGRVEKTKAVQDSVESRAALWLYLEQYLLLQRPYIWYKGAPDAPF